MRHLSCILMTAASLMLSEGCIDEFDPSTLIASTRVIGAHVQVVDAEPERAWPEPGETAHVQWWVVHPGAPRMLRSVFFRCPAAPTQFGLERCEGLPAPTPSCEPRDRGPCVSVEVPHQVEVAQEEEARELLLIGGICAGGEPTVDLESRTFGCEGDGAEGTPVTLTIPLGRDGGTAPNQHPRLDHVVLGGASWPPPPPTVLDAPAGPCPEDAELPTVAPGTTVQVAVVPSPDSFESFEEVVETETAMQIEEVQVSHFATGGDLDQQFVFVNPATAREEVGWTSPGQVAPEGLLVRFHFVLRDGRGGTAWATRALCVR